ncbi:hypothetical protein N658DRAFT_353202 [Parathielavia hyrcaniae]|uniref:Uncharacterized protein n=1 Tax=Parathielavia hyrcaniae TaxID=113614 RepID=A0AAN6Q286_9PEZI|nr:hypothetical protein N658DRAFT_353202 [Parathielavia hyrcaniae]
MPLAMSCSVDMMFPTAGYLLAERAADSVPFEHVIIGPAATRTPRILLSRTALQTGRKSEAIKRWCNLEDMSGFRKPQGLRDLSICKITKRDCTLLQFPPSGPPGVPSLYHAIRLDFAVEIFSTPGRTVQTPTPSPSHCLPPFPLMIQPSIRQKA